MPSSSFRAQSEFFVQSLEVLLLGGRSTVIKLNGGESSVHCREVRKVLFRGASSHYRRFTCIAQCNRLTLPFLSVGKCKKSDWYSVLNRCNSVCSLDSVVHDCMFCCLVQIN